MSKYLRDYRDEAGVGYVIESAANGYRWLWIEPAFDNDSNGRWFVTLAEALRDAAADWEVAGSGGNQASVLKAQATRADKH